MQDVDEAALRRGMILVNLVSIHTWRSANSRRFSRGFAFHLPVPLPKLRITQPRRHQPRELPVFPNASCLGTLSHDSPRPRGVIYRLAVTSHDSRSTAIAGSTICDFSSMAPYLVCERQQFDESNVSDNFLA